MKTVNEKGLAEIRAFLTENHKLGGDLTRSQLLAWAEDAEFQLSEGNPACIEIKSWESVSGRTEEYTISDDGLDCCEVPAPITLDDALDGWHKLAILEHETAQDFADAFLASPDSDDLAGDPSIMDIECACRARWDWLRACAPIQDSY